MEKKQAALPPGADLGELDAKALKDVRDEIYVRQNTGISMAKAIDH